MSDVFIKFVPIPEGEQVTGFVFKVNGVDKYTVHLGGIKVATPDQYDDPDIGWIELPENL